MPSRDYYLQQAKLLFEMAAKMSAKDDAARLISRANEYQMLAKAMPDDAPASPVPPRPPVSQPMQQQLQKKSEDK